MATSDAEKPEPIVIKKYANRRLYNTQSSSYITLEDLSRMTREEKIDCLATRASVPRLGVKGSPHIEGYHGVAQGGPSNWGRRNPTPTTQFPQAYGLGSTWDPELVRKAAAQQAQEARYLYQSEKYNRSGIIVRAPQADLARDPRWGRTEEVFGEDPFHVGTLATAFSTMVGSSAAAGQFGVVSVISISTARSSLISTL